MYRKGNVPKRGEESELIVHSWTRKGFFGSYATLYKTHNPGAPIRWDKGLGPEAIAVDQSQPADLHIPDGRPMPLLSNGNITVSVSRRSSPMPFCWRNADADELYFIHRGEARFETELGILAAEPGDFIYLPRNIVYRLVPQTEDNLHLILETRSLLETAESYHRDHGETGAGLDMTLIAVPEPGTNGSAHQAEYEVRTKVDGEVYSAYFDYDPVGVTVGWAGDPIVFKLSAWDVPCARLPSTPPTAAVFITEEKDCVVTVHTPMGIPGRSGGPPAHSNDFDELWFRHSAATMEGAEPSLLRWDPQGVTQPGFRRLAGGNGQRREPDLRSLNLNIDVKQRLRLTKEAEGYLVEQRQTAGTTA